MTKKYLNLGRFTEDITAIIALDSFPGGVVSNIVSKFSAIVVTPGDHVVPVGPCEQVSINPTVHIWFSNYVLPQANAISILITVKKESLNLLSFQKV